MMHRLCHRLLFCFGFCLCFLSNLRSEAQRVRLKIALPDIGNNTILIMWDPVAGAQEYQYQRKENNSVYSGWKTLIGLNTYHYDLGLNPASEYSYKVRVKVAGNTDFGEPSNPKTTSFKRVWPVRKARD